LIKKGLQSFEENTKSPLECSTCGKATLPEFKVCLYCRENIKLLPQQAMGLKKYK